MHARPLFALAVAALALAGTFKEAQSLHADEAVKGKLVYCQKDGERVQLHTMNLDGTGARAIPGFTASVVVFPHWSPDGKQIAFMAGEKLQDNAFTLGICKADGTGQKTLPLPHKLAGLPAWSPDGKALLFVAGDQRPEVYTSDPDLNGLRKLTPEGENWLFPFWMPDGKRLGFSRFVMNELKSELVLANLDGTGPETLTSAMSLLMAGASAVSPDGKKLIYSEVNPMMKTGFLRLWDLATKTESLITEFKLAESGGPDGMPTASWSVDGKHFVVGMPTEQGIGLVRFTADGKTQTRISPVGVHCFGPSLTAGG